MVIEAGDDLLHVDRIETVIIEAIVPWSILATHDGGIQTLIDTIEECTG